MKRRDLIRHLEKNGCESLREGGKLTAELRELPLFQDTENWASSW